MQLSTGKQLSILLSVLVGGIGLVAVAATIAVGTIRDEVLHLSQETSPTQVRLATLQRGFERINAAFTRISAASTEEELAGSEFELAQTMTAVRSVASEKSTAAGAAVASVQGGAIDSMNRTGDELRRIARQRIDARKEIADASAAVAGEIERVSRVAGTLSAAMARLEASSQGALVSSKKTSIDANSSIRSLLIEREKLEQLRSCLREAGTIDAKFRLNVLRDKVGGILDDMASQVLSEEHLASAVRSFVTRFGEMFDGDSGLLAARVGTIATPRDGAALAGYEARRKATAGAIDDLSGMIAEGIDPLELATVKANVGINQATERIAQAIAVSAAAADVNARARSIEALAWQLLAASDSGAVDRIVASIARQNDEVNRSLDVIHQSLIDHAWDTDADAPDAARQAFARIRHVLTGPAGVASAARLNLEKQVQAERLFSTALNSIRQVAAAASTRARSAEEAQQQAVTRIRNLLVRTFFFVGIVALAALVGGSVVGARIRRRILTEEGDQRRLKNKLRDQAFQDALTGLPNRLFFVEALEQSIEAAESGDAALAVLCVDLDRLKQVNDMLGHRIGDLYLIEASKRMDRTVGKNGVVARTGGDEFTILLTEVRSKDQVKSIAESLLIALSEPIVIDNCSLEASGSIGIALFPEDGTDAETLQRNSDQAMYRAKRSGRNQVASFDFRLNQSIQEGNEIREGLRDAVRSGDFRIHYQPQVSPDGEVMCLEALLRYRHRQFGDISPARFIPIAEESGLILPIGAWVLREVARQSMDWQRAGFRPVRIAVNVSALQFAQVDFFESVSRILEESGMAPELLELELTETAVMSKPEEAWRQMSKLRALGVHLSIDDFGTGYSSLSYLHQLPVNTLKIDQSFVRDIQSPNSSLPLIEAIVSAGHALGLSVVAEGVETNFQKQALIGIGCDTMQGYLFARPLPVEAIEKMLPANRRSCGREVFGTLERKEQLQLAG